jgi:hypothetical protein
MQTIQLYVDGQRVEMFSDESIQLTSSIQDVRDISKIFTDYSQTFNVPASKTNNKIFKHYYNNSIQNGYDARFRSEAIIELNHTPFKNGTIRLNRVQMKNNKPYSYELTFFGSMVSLSRILGDDKLKVLDLSDYDHEWTYANVRQGLETGLSFNGDTSAIIYPLISPKRRIIFDSDPSYAPSPEQEEVIANIGGATAAGGIRPQDLKPAIRLIRIIEAIEDKYPLTFSRDFFGGALFEQIYMWLHRGAGQIEYSDGTSTQIVSNWALNTESLPCISDTIGEGEAFFYDDYFDFRSTFSNTEDYIDGQAELTITPDDLSGEYSYKIIDLISDVTLFEDTDVTGVQTHTVDMYTPSGQSSKDWQIQVQISTESGSTMLLYDAEWYVRTYFLTSSGDLDCLNEQRYEALSQNMIGEVILQNQTPDLKIIDLLTGLFKMFNLTSYINNQGTIVVDTLDNYYDSYANATKHDISKYIKVDESSVERVPLYGNIDFKFRDPSTFLSVEFNERNGFKFGDESYNVIINGEYIDGENYDIQLPFEKVVYERLTDSFDGSETPASYGWFVSDNEEPIQGGPLLFFNVNEDIPDEDMYIRSQDGVTNNSLSSYNRPSNVTEDQTQTLNFDQENDEFNLVFNEESLFKNFYQNYIESVFNQYNRITKINALLPIKVLTKYELKDRFIINGKSYKINSVTSNLLNGNSQVELIEDIE